MSLLNKGNSLCLKFVRDTCLPLKSKNVKHVLSFLLTNTQKWLLVILQIANFLYVFHLATTIRTYFSVMLLTQIILAWS